MSGEKATPGGSQTMYAPGRAVVAALSQTRRLRGQKERVYAVEMSTPELLQTITDQARLIAGCKYAALEIFGERGVGVQSVFTSGISAEERAAIGELPKGLGLLGELEKLRRPLRIRDIGAHTASVGFLPGHPPMKSFLGVPIRSGEVSLGGLYLTEKEGADEFSQEDEERVVLFASLAAMAIENDTLTNEARERTEEAEAAAVLASIVASSLDLDDVFEQFAQEVRAIVPFNRMAINLINEDQQTFRVGYLLGPGHGFELHQSYPLKGSVTGLVAPAAP